MNHSDATVKILSNFRRIPISLSLISSRSSPLSLSGKERDGNKKKKGRGEKQVPHVFLQLLSPSVVDDNGAKQCSLAAAKRNLMSSQNIL